MRSGRQRLDLPRPRLPSFNPRLHENEIEEKLGGERPIVKANTDEKHRLVDFQSAQIRKYNASRLLWQRILWQIAYFDSFRIHYSVQKWLLLLWNHRIMWQSVTVTHSPFPNCVRSTVFRLKHACVVCVELPSSECVADGQGRRKAKANSQCHFPNNGFASRSRRRPSPTQLRLGAASKRKRPFAVEDAFASGLQLSMPFFSSPAKKIDRLILCYANLRHLPKILAFSLQSWPKTLVL